MFTPFVWCLLFYFLLTGSGSCATPEDDDLSSFVLVDAPSASRAALKLPDEDSFVFVEKPSKERSILYTHLECRGIAQGHWDEFATFLEPLVHGMDSDAIWSVMDFSIGKGMKLVVPVDQRQLFHERILPRLKKNLYDDCDERRRIMVIYENRGTVEQALQRLDEPRIIPLEQPLLDWIWDKNAAPFWVRGTALCVATPFVMGSQLLACSIDSYERGKISLFRLSAGWAIILPFGAFLLINPSISNGGTKWSCNAC